VRHSTEDRQALETLAANLKSWRDKRGFTQEALAEEAQTSVFTIQAIERGRSNPSFVIVLRLARALRCPLDELTKTAFLVRRRGAPVRWAGASRRR